MPISRRLLLLALLAICAGCKTTSTQKMEIGVELDLSRKDETDLYFPSIQYDRAVGLVDNQLEPAQEVHSN
jgi:hypothetical protein